jgi:predicted AAA+ superfamily ATPase
MINEVSMIRRIVTADSLAAGTSFLWGPRDTGKTTLVRELFPQAKIFSLDPMEEVPRLSADPTIFARECLALPDKRQPVIVDEIQNLPQLLGHIRSLIGQQGLRFLLVGSSPRKLVHGGAGPLPGEATTLNLMPLTSAEVPDLSLERALHRGLLPSHYFSDRASSRLRKYCEEFLWQEVLAEGLIRNLPAFQQFLRAAALSNGQIVNSATIARRIAVSPNTVRGYFNLLVDTLIAAWLPSWTKRVERRAIRAPKFYFFDVGVVNGLVGRGSLVPGSASFALALEHFVLMELRAHQAYAPRGSGLPITYWRTASGIEVDFILGDAEVAVEVKATEHPRLVDLRSLRAWREEHPSSRCILVCRTARPARSEDGIEIMPWRDFLAQLWRHEIRAGRGSE